MPVTTFWPFLGLCHLMFVSHFSTSSPVYVLPQSCCMMLRMSGRSIAIGHSHLACRALDLAVQSSCAVASPILIPAVVMSMCLGWYGVGAFQHSLETVLLVSLEANQPPRNEPWPVSCARSRVNFIHQVFTRWLPRPRQDFKNKRGFIHAPPPSSRCSAVLRG